MSIRIKCPHCKGVMESPDNLLGALARCPYCGKVVTVEKIDPAGPASAPQATPAGGNGGTSPAWTTPGVEPAPHHIMLAPTVEAAALRGPGAAGEQAEFADVADSAAAAPHPEPFQVDGPVGLVLGTREHRRKRNRFLVLLKSLWRHGNPTDASVLITAAMAVAMTVLVYRMVAIDSIRTSYVGVLLTERTWVVHVTVFLAMWAATILLVKLWKLASQETALSYDLLPTDPSVKIHPGNVNLVQEHIKKLPVNPRRNFLVNRVLVGLNYFQARRSVQDAGALLNSQADLDAAVVESSYAMLRVLVWAIPILGFIGTVLGISDSVTGFEHSIKEAQELDKIKTALGQVTSGLAVAFDTTLIALVLSVLIMFPMNSLQKAEEDLLSSVDKFCNENLLPRLTTTAPEKGVRPRDSRGSDPFFGPGTASTDMGASQREPPVDEVRILMNAYQSAFEDWQKRLENLETALFEKVVDSLGDIRKELGKKHPLPQVLTRDGG